MSPGGNRLRTWLVLFLLLACQPQLQAAGLLVVASSSADLYSRFIETLAASLAESAPKTGGADVTVVYLDQHALTEGDLASGDLVLTVGTRAAREVIARQPDKPLLHTVIPESVYRTLSTGSGVCARQSAIFIDQPLARQAALAQAMFPSAVNFGILLGPTSSQRQAEVGALENTSDRKLVVRVTAVEANIAEAVNGLLQKVDLILAVNDPLVLNRENAKWLLYSAYQHRLPVIGFSRAYVIAGAAGAVFSEPEQIARQAAEIVLHHIASPTGCLPAADFPRYFSTSVNESVCSSLGGSLCDAQMLDEQLSKGVSGK